MVEIVLEDVLFVALVATLVVLLVVALVEFTPLGLRLRQARNRRVIEETAERTCPMHGAHAATEMVLLPSGERICPECFKEVVNE